MHFISKPNILSSPFGKKLALLQEGQFSKLKSLPQSS
jgi:hypothetical protein